MTRRPCPLLATLVASLVALTAQAGTPANGGSLVLVGGALRPDNAAVHEAFIGRLPPEGRVVIIPAASGQPAKAAGRFSAALQDHGLAAVRITVFPLAVRDDSSTEGIDESEWAQNAWDPGLVEAIEDAAGFWFTGGDQARITASLRNAAGEESPLLQLIRSRLAGGAVVGGTSAGAAIMSEDMIAGGDSFRALTQPLAEGYASMEEQDSGRLSLLPGLGFFPFGIVDQHFDRKARLGRLVRALVETEATAGFGIDEDTALVVDLASGRGRVAGSGNVVLVDIADARLGSAPGEIVAGVRLGVAHEGVEIALAGQRLLGGMGKPTRASPYYGHEPLQGGGMAFANARLDHLLGHDLLDNHASSDLRRYSIDGEGAVLIYRFYETEHSEGYWDDRVGDRYSASAVGFDVLVKPGP
jgi:cyanophycinase